MFGFTSGQLHHTKQKGTSSSCSGLPVVSHTAPNKREQVARVRGYQWSVTPHQTKGKWQRVWVNVRYQRTRASPITCAAGLNSDWAVFVVSVWTQLRLGCLCGPCMDSTQTGLSLWSVYGLNSDWAVFVVSVWTQTHTGLSLWSEYGLSSNWAVFVVRVWIQTGLSLWSVMIQLSLGCLCGQSMDSDWAVFVVSVLTQLRLGCLCGQTRLNSVWAVFVVRVWTQTGLSLWSVDDLTQTGLSLWSVYGLNSDWDVFVVRVQKTG